MDTHTVVIDALLADPRRTATIAWQAKVSHSDIMLALYGKKRLGWWQQKRLQRALHHA